MAVRGISWRGLVVAAAAAVAAGVTGCANQDSALEVGLPDVLPDVPVAAAPGPATPAFLAEVATRSMGQPYRYEITISMRGFPGMGAVEGVRLASGEVVGGRERAVVDLGELVAAISGEHLPAAMRAEMIMEMVMDGDVMYLRSAIFGSMADLVGPEAAGELGALSQMGDGWGRVDLTAVPGLVPEDVVAAIGGTQGYDPGLILEAVTGAADVEQLGSDVVGGHRVTGYAADVSAADLLQAQGLDPATLGLGPEANGYLDALAALTMPLEVWVDADVHVRRLVMEISGEQLMLLFAELDDEMLAEMAGLFGSFSMSVTADLSDHGDPGIVIDVPADALDVTAAFAGLAATGPG